MASKKVREQGGAPDVADQASLAVRKAIGPLVKLLDHENDHVILAAAEALGRLGAQLVVGPLADALVRAKSARHRGLIVRMLRRCASEERLRVLSALHPALKREKNLEVAAIIYKAIVDVTLSTKANGN